MKSLCAHFDDESDDNAAKQSQTKTSTSPGWQTHTTFHKLSGENCPISSIPFVNS